MRRPIVAPRQGAGDGLFRSLPKLLLFALVALLFGGCSSTPGLAGRAAAPAAVQAVASDAGSTIGSATVFASGSAPAPAGGWNAALSSTAVPMPRLFSHRLLAPPLQLIQISLSGATPTVLAAMQRFAAAAPPALEPRGLLYAQATLEPEAGWLTLTARSQGVDWVFGVQFTVDGGGRLLTLRLRTAGAGNIDNPRPKEMDAHIATLAAVMPQLFPQ